MVSAEPAWESLSLSPSLSVPPLLVCSVFLSLSLRKINLKNFVKRWLELRPCDNKDINNDNDKDNPNGYHFSNTRDVPATYDFQLQNNLATRVLLPTTL